MTLVIRPALLVLARSVAYPAPPAPLPGSPMLMNSFHIQPQSGIIEIVLTTSSQKKKLRKKNKPSGELKKNVRKKRNPLKRPLPIQ